jgi:hypothetical protein
LSWGPSRAIARFILAAGLLLGAGSALADILVVRSTGPSAKSFPPGKRLPETERISLKPLDQLALLDGRGTRIVRGPGTFTAGVPTPVRLHSGLASQRRSRIGAVRSGEAAQLGPPSIWHVDVAKSSNVCVANPSELTLWRADPAKTVSLDIGGARGRTKRLDWPSGSSTLDWPSDLPVTEGAQYRLSRSGGAGWTGIRFRTLPATPAGLEDTAQALIRNRCDAQLDHFIETVKLPE